MIRRFALAVLISALTGCSHGGSVFTPSVPAGMLPQSFVQLAATQGEVKFTFTVPFLEVDVRPRYVSAFTKSIAIKVYDATGTKLLATKNANLTKTSKGCKNGTKGLVCILTFAVKAGSDLFDATAFDRLDEKGKTLSALENFPRKVVAGKTTTIPLVMGGLAKSIVMFPPLTEAVTGSKSTGFSIIGSHPWGFEIVPIDADSNYIIGPGAPRVRVTNVPTALTIASPSPKLPGSWTLTSTFEKATSPIVPHDTELDVEATPVPNSGGKTVKASIVLHLYQPWIYVANYGLNTIKAFDEAGKAKSLSGTFSGLTPEPGYLAYSGVTHDLYIVPYDATGVQVYDLTGHAVTVSGTFPNTDGTGQLAIDTNTNTIFVPNYSAGSTNYITAYDLNGNPKTVGASEFSGMAGGAWLMAFDKFTSEMYAINWNSDVGAGYNESGVTETGVSAFPNVTGPYSLTIDAHIGRIYVGDASGITVYDLNGTQQSVPGTWANRSSTYPMVEYDPYNDRLYGTACCGNPSTVTEYDTIGKQQTLPVGAFSGLSEPMGMAFVP